MYYTIIGECLPYLWELVIVFVELGEGDPESVRFTHGLLHIHCLHCLRESIDHLHVHVHVPQVANVICAHDYICT